MIIIIITRITSKHKRNIPKSRNDHRTEKPKNNFNLKNNSDNNNAYKDGNNSNNIIIHLTMKITMATSKLAAWITMSNQQRIK